LVSGRDRRKSFDFEPWLERWGLMRDGEAIVTPASDLLPVLRGGQAAMLKVSHEEEERWGWLVLDWWDGEGAVRVLAHEGDGVLLERAIGSRSLVGMAAAGEDEEATRIICAAAAVLHGQRRAPPADLVPLSAWFAPLTERADRPGVLGEAARTARRLLAEPREVVVLHGDLHHGNILDGGERGWLAIDPKRLIGERGFDFANVIRNPFELGIATAPERFRAQADIIADTAAIERKRLLEWTLAFAGLSAVWILDDGDDPATDMTVAELAAALLAGD
jgi:streptomycin 6-kinase